MIATVHSVASGLALDGLCVVDVGRASSDAMFRVNGADIGLAVDQGILGQESKLGGNALLLHELVFSARKFGAENTLWSLCLVSRDVPGRACRLSLQKSLCGGAPLPLFGNKRFIMHVLTRAFLFSSVC